MSLVDRQSVCAIQDHHLHLNSLYFDHRETVQHIQNALLTQILPNVVDELGLDKVARGLAEEWVHDDCKSQLCLAQAYKSAPLIFESETVSIFRTLKVREHGSAAASRASGRPVDVNTTSSAA